MEIRDFLNLLSQNKNTNGVTFANITYRSKGDNQLAKFHCLLGVSTENTYDSDIEELESAVSVMNGIDKVAAEELLASRRESKEKGVGNNSQWTHRGHVEPTEHKGVSVNMENGEIYLTVQVLDKKVIEKGEEKKKVNSSAKTIAKNKIRQSLKSSRIRTFVISKIQRAAMNGEVLEVEG